MGTKTTAAIIPPDVPFDAGMLDSVCVVEDVKEIVVVVAEVDLGLVLLVEPGRSEFSYTIRTP